MAQIVSKVLHVSPLPDGTTPAELSRVLAPYGRISRMMMMPQSHSGLVEFDHLDDACRLVDSSRTRPVVLAGQPVRISYSHSGDLKEHRSSLRVGSDGVPALPALSARVPSSGGAGSGRCLLLTIQKALFNIDCTVLEAILRPHGELLRAVVFERDGQVHALVEFRLASQATAAMLALQGRHIYDNCCTLKITPAHQETLSIKENGARSRDWTNPNLRTAAPASGALSQAPHHSSAQGQQQQQPAQAPYHGDSGGGGYGSRYPAAPAAALPVQQQQSGGDSYGGGGYRRDTTPLQQQLPLARGGQQQQPLSRGYASQQLPVTQQQQPSHGLPLMYGSSGPDPYARDTTPYSAPQSQSRGDPGSYYGGSTGSGAPQRAQQQPPYEAQGGLAKRGRIDGPPGQTQYYYDERQQGGGQQPAAPQYRSTSVGPGGGAGDYGRQAPLASQSQSSSGYGGAGPSGSYSSSGSTGGGAYSGGSAPVRGGYGAPSGQQGGGSRGYGGGYDDNQQRSGGYDGGAVGGSGSGGSGYYASSGGAGGSRGGPAPYNSSGGGAGAAPRNPLPMGGRDTGSPGDAGHRPGYPRMANSALGAWGSRPPPAASGALPLAANPSNRLGPRGSEPPVRYPPGSSAGFLLEGEPGAVIMIYGLPRWEKTGPPAPAPAAGSSPAPAAVASTPGPGEPGAAPAAQGPDATAPTTPNGAAAAAGAAPEEGGTQAPAAPLVADDPMGQPETAPAPAAAVAPAPEAPVSPAAAASPAGEQQQQQEAEEAGKPTLDSEAALKPGYAAAAAAPTAAQEAAGGDPTAPVTTASTAGDAAASSLAPPTTPASAPGAPASPRSTTGSSFSAGGAAPSGDKSAPPTRPPTTAPPAVTGTPVDLIDAIFNLLCPFGNVLRVKLLQSPPGTAMVQMGDAAQADVAISLLRGASIRGTPLQVTRSKQSFVKTSRSSEDWANTREFVDSAKNRFRRLVGPPRYMNGPCTSLYFSNMDAAVDEQRITGVLAKLGAPLPSYVRFVSSRGGDRDGGAGGGAKGKVGFLDYESIDTATEAMMIANNFDLGPRCVRLSFGTRGAAAPPPVSRGERPAHRGDAATASAAGAGATTTAAASGGAAAPVSPVAASEPAAAAAEEVAAGGDPTAPSLPDAPAPASAAPPSDASNAAAAVAAAVAAAAVAEDEAEAALAADDQQRQQAEDDADALDKGQQGQAMMDTEAAADHAGQVAGHKRAREEEGAPVLEAQQEEAAAHVSEQAEAAGESATATAVSGPEEA